jgi:hypothetical protein
MEELLPPSAGLVLGALLGFERTPIRVPVGAALATALGVLATVASGESNATWAYLLIDISLVAVAAVAGFRVTRRLSTAAREA